jgi:integrase
MENNSYAHRRNHQKNVVSWTVRGKKRTGKLSKTGKVSIQVDTWTVQFTDETGKVRRVSTKTTNRSAAEKMLVRHETEIDRIRAGVMTREELTKAPIRSATLDEALEQFQIKLTANGNIPQYIHATMQQVLSILQECNIETIANIRRETIERWIAGELQKKVRSMRTINGYLISIKSFVSYLMDIELVPSNPLKPIKKLNQELDRRKVRRTMTADEVKRLLSVVDARRQLIYRLLLGIGLRSMELSLLTPEQIDFERCRLRIEAAKTKNKKADVLPLHPDLVQSVKEWVEMHGIQPQERIFHYNTDSLRRSFYKDLQAADIERKGTDGRSLDVHSLRKTFGTMLARAGVPLTTTQRLMRHSTPLLTAKLYIDVEEVDMMQALGKLPMFETEKHCREFSS